MGWLLNGVDWEMGEAYIEGVHCAAKEQRYQAPKQEAITSSRASFQHSA